MSVSPGLKLASFRMAAVGVSTVSMMVVARALGPVGYGPYAAAAALFVLPQSAGILGGDQLFLSGHIDVAALRRLAARASLLTGALGVLIAIVHPSLTPEARMTLILLSISGTAEMARLPWLLEPQGLEQFNRRGRRELAARCVTASALIVAAVSGLPAPGLAGFAAASNLCLTAGWVLTRARAEALPRAEPLLPMLRKGAPYTATSLLYTAYVSMPMIVVASVASAESTSFFRTASFVLLVGYVLPAALNGEVLRSLLYNVRRGRREAPVRLRHFLVTNVVAGGLAALGTWLLLGRVLELLLGSAYAGVSELATILALSLPANYVNSLLDNVLIAYGLVTRVAMIQGATLCFSVILVPWVTAEHGATGAAWSLLACELFATTCYSLAHLRLRQRAGLGDQAVLGV